MPSDSARPELVLRTTCRGCGGRDLEQILSLGPSPLANAFLRSTDEFAGERRYPLDLFFCGQCSLLQLLHVVDPDILFRHYLYVTGTSTTMAAHNRAYAQTVADLLRLQPADLVAEVASNDGSLLKCFQQHGVRTVGIEPAGNLSASASAAGIETLNEFFTLAVATKVRAERGAARVVAANNVLAHVDDPVDFLSGCRELLADDGLVTIEVPYVGALLDRLEYDTVYHEHLSYFSVRSLLWLCDRVGLSVVRIDRVPVHGGSLRLYLSRSAAGHAPEVRALEAEERQAGVTEVARYRRFAHDVEAGRAELVGLLQRLTGEGKRVAGYGAPAKGNTLLNYCGIDTRLLPYTVDKNPLKVGLFTPGTHIPVRDVATLSNGASPPDYVLILAWNFAEEIMDQQRAHRDRGGRFILPVPRPQVV
jgi:novobiocin biosynthesis protein NovU/D-mycarose 3-C-methyltransferase